MLVQFMKAVFPVAYISFGIITYILFLIRGRIIYKELKREYPSFTDNYVEHHKEKSVYEPIIQQLSIFISCFIPIINLSLFYNSVISKDRLKEKVLDKMTNTEEI